MTIELVSKNDCVSNGDRSKEKNGKGKGKIDCSHKNIEYKGIMLKRITNRDRKRCFKCGHDNGIWYEYFMKGRREYHFLCQSCIDDIESGKG